MNFKTSEINDPNEFIWGKIHIKKKKKKKKQLKF